MLTFTEAIVEVGKAEPEARTLYVRRDVLNQDEIAAWAKANWFQTTLTDMHVTVAYSKDKLPWPDPEDDGMVVGGGARSMALFGDDDERATVLRFESAPLESRWQELKDFGAAWKWDEFETPHHDKLRRAR